MAEKQRIARMVEDEDRTVDVFRLNVTEVREADTDPFLQKNLEIRSLEGTGASFKRRVTNELRKARTGADGTASKQIDDAREITGYDAFGVVHPPHSLESFARIYELSAPHYAAVNAKVANIVGLGYTLVESPKTKRASEAIEDQARLKRTRQRLDLAREEIYEQIEDWNVEETFTEVLSKVWRDYEVTGNGYLEIGRKRDGSIGYVGHVPAQSIRVRRKRDGFVQISANKAQFFANFGAGGADPETGRIKVPSNPIADDRPNELLHIKKHSPANSYYGIPDIVAAQQAVAGNEFAARFNLDYFENKAVPRHVITLKGANLSASSQAELLRFFETGLKGQNHRSLFIPLPADDGNNKVEFKIEAVEAGTQDSSFNNYYKSNTNLILMAHRVPITKVSIADSASLAIARDADKTFKEQICAPEQKNFEKKLNRLIKETTDAFVFKLNEMTLTDEDTQSKIDERRIKTGTETPNEQRARRGLPAIKGGDELVDLNAKDKIAQQKAEMTTTRERDSERSAAASDSAGEARQPKGDGRAVG